MLRAGSLHALAPHGGLQDLRPGRAQLLARGDLPGGSTARAWSSSASACGCHWTLCGAAAAQHAAWQGVTMHHHRQRYRRLATAALGPAAGSGGRPLLVLGIESSCDDTAAAVVTSDGRVLSEAIASQADLHAPWGGVVPKLAQEAHAAAIDQVVAAALAGAGLSSAAALDAVAVTVGPGLSLCLHVGVTKARQVAREAGLPMVAVHHMEAHALVARLPATPVAGAVSQIVPLLPPKPEPEPTPGQADEAAAGAGGAAQRQPARPAASGSGGGPQAQGGPQGAGPGPGALAAAAAHEGEALDLGLRPAALSAVARLPYPFLCLLVSGGHNLLVLVRGPGAYVQLGATLDDAIGEAYDKVARLLGLELKPHGGAALEALARSGRAGAVKFARPMAKHANCDFSFAGLKTSARLAIEARLGPEARAAMAGGEAEAGQVAADIAASFQATAAAHLAERVTRGCAWARELVEEEGGQGGGKAAQAAAQHAQEGQAAPQPARLRHLVVAGGVAANQYIRASLQAVADAQGLELVLPPPRWCTDNGVMVAWAGIERLAQGWAEPPPPPLPAQPQQAADEAQPQPQEWVELRPRWPLTAERHPRAAQQSQLRSAKRVRLHTPLSTMPRVSVAGGAGESREQQSATEADSALGSGMMC